MKSSMKFALSLLIGSSVFALAACDHQEAKTPEKSTALSQDSQTAPVQNTEDKTSNVEEKANTVTQTENATTEASNISETTKAPMVETAKVETDLAKEATAPTANENAETPNASEEHHKKMKKAHHESAYLKEQKAMLHALESQYRQIRCTPAAAQLGDNSFCHQEERRLTAEIERVKNEIKINR